MNNSLNCNLVFLSISISFVFLIYLRPELLSTLEHVLKKVKLDSLAIASLTYVIGNGFNTVVALGADHPNLLQAALKSFPPPAEEQPFCPTGFVLAQNSTHVPSANGCGASYIKLAGNFLPYKELENCCNAHDICYDTCYITWSYQRERCDILFKECLATICAMKQREETWTCYFYAFLTWKPTEDSCENFSLESRNRQCNTSVEVLYRFVESFGKKAYENAQKQACICVPESPLINLAFKWFSYIIGICFIVVTFRTCFHLIRIYRF